MAHMPERLSSIDSFMEKIFANDPRTAASQEAMTRLIALAACLVVGASAGGVLESMGGISAKLAAARSAILAKFDAARGHDADGYGSSAAWLAAKNKVTRRDANAEVRLMRQFDAAAAGRPR